MNGFFSASAVQQERRGGLIARCGACGLHKTCLSPRMEVWGRGAKEVMVIGEAPGQTEDEEGRPFVGKAGQYLRDALNEIDISLEQDAWVTNALICRPPKNATPDAKQIAYCRPHVLAALEQYDPRVVIVLGKSALVSVLDCYWKGDVGPMEKWAGWRIPLPKHWVCPTYHPAYLLRMKNALLDKLFLEHLQAAFELDVDPPPQPDFEKLIRLVYDEREVYGRLGEMDLGGGWLAVDYETNSLKPEWPKARIVSCAVSNGKQTLAYPWTPRTAQLTGKLLASARTYKIASNLKFEERWTLKTFGHGVTNWGWDTMLAAHCLDNRTGITGLKFQSFIHLGVQSYNENVEPYLFSFDGPYNRVTDIELPTLLFYNGMDAILEYKLAMRQRKEMGYERD